MFSRFTLVIVALAAVGSSANAAASECSRNYTVVAGDTCDSISAKENVSTFQLVSANNGTIGPNCDELFVGEALCLGIVGQDCDVTHVVASGESCQSIAAKAGTTLDLILANNPNVNQRCSNIYPGEVLCTADDLVVKPSPGPTSRSARATPTSGSGFTWIHPISGFSLANFPITTFSAAIATPSAACGPKCCTVC